MKTNQEIFDKVSVHLLTQNRKSHLPGAKDLCAYRGVDGCKCAVGVMIYDEHYIKELEDKLARSSSVQTALIASGVPAWIVGEEYLLIDLQLVHDLYPPEMWRDGLQDVAAEFDLNTTAMDAVVAGAES